MFAILLKPAKLMVTRGARAVSHTCWFLFALLLAFPQTGSAVTNTFTFNYTNRAALFADGWDYLARRTNGTVRNTETTNGVTPPDVSYDQAAHPGTLRVPAYFGDLAYGNNDTRNQLFRNLPTNWTRVEAAFTFDPLENYQSVDLCLYQDDDNYAQLAFGFAGSKLVSFQRETNAVPLTINYLSGLSTNITNIWLRLEREFYKGDLTAFYSTNGTNWTLVGRTSQAFLNPRVSVFSGGGYGNFAIADFRAVTVATSDSAVGTKLVTYPVSLVFNTTAGQPCTNVQILRLVNRGPDPINWTMSSTASWLSATPTNGPASGVQSSSCDVRVNSTNLSAGVYQGALIFAGTGATNSPLSVSVTLIVNPAARAQVASWKGDRKAALSVSVDDGQPSMFSILTNYGFGGTYVMNGTTAPPLFSSFYQHGMELGPHLIDHVCNVFDEPTMRYELGANIDGLNATTVQPSNEVLSAIFPCGVSDHRMKVVAGDYVLSARGYGINLLEDRTPYDFMDLKSFNSHGASLDTGNDLNPTPTNFLPLVDLAMDQGKWLNLVFHGSSDDDGSVAYAATTNVWVAPIGRVVKYIQQRDRTIISNYVESAGSIAFSAWRLGIPASDLRSFETGVLSNDVISFRVDLTDVIPLGLSINGVATTNYVVQNGPSGNSLVFDTTVSGTPKQVQVLLQTNQPPVLTAVGTQTAVEGILLSVTNVATDPENGRLTWSLGAGAPTGLALSTNGLVTWAPGETAGGFSFPVQVIVTDDGVPPLKATNNFTINVLETNSAPSIAGVSNQTTAAGLTLVITNAATDSDIPANTLTFGLGPNAPAGMSITSGGVLSWSPTDPQGGSNYTVKVVVTDNGTPPLSATNSFIVAVLPRNHAPNLSQPGPQSFYELTTVTITNTATDSDLTNTLTYQLVNPPAGASINGNGVITWTPTEAQGPSTNSLVTIVTDNGLPTLSATNAITVIVMESNTPPQISTNANALIVAGRTLTITNSATDSDIPANTLVFSLGAGAPEGMTITTNGILNWTPATHLGGSNFTVTVVVTDSNPWATGAGQLSASNSFNVEVLPSPLVLVPQTNRSVLETSTLVVTNVVIDEDLTNAPLAGQLVTNTFVFSYTNRQDLLANGWDFLGRTPAGSTRDTEITNPAVGQVLSYDQAAHPGRLRIPCDSGDLYGGTLNDTRNSLFRDLSSNWVSLKLHMIFAPTASVQQAHMALYQNDDNYIEVGQAFNGGAGGQLATMISEAGAIPSTASALLPTTNDVTVRLDRNLASNSVTGSYSLDGTNWTVIGQRNNNLSSPRLAIWASATDGLHPNCDLLQLEIVVTNGPRYLTFSLVNPPTGAAINTNGVITWTPTEDQGPGAYTLTTAVSDNWIPPLTATNSFVVTVLESNLPPVLQPIADQVIVENTTLTITNQATDPDIPANTLVFSLMSAPAGADISTNSGVITWNPGEADGPSTNVFVVRVTDSGSPQLSSTQTFAVMVQESNLPPVLPVQADRTISGLAPLIVTNSATDPDLPANPLTYSLLAAPAGASISPSGVISWTPGPADQGTTNLFQTVVTDTSLLAINAQHLSATNSFSVVVDSRPILNAQAALTAEACQPTNGVIDPGETVTISITLHNTGLGDTTNLIATLLQTNGVSAASGPQSFGVVAAGGPGVTRTFSFSAIGSCGATISPTVQLQDGSQDLGTASASFVLGLPNTMFTETFDEVPQPSLPSGWTTASSGTEAPWRTTNSLADSSPNAAFVSDSAGVGTADLISPPMLVSVTGAQLSFRNRFDLEGGSGSVAYDGGVLEIKIGTNAFVDIVAAGGSFVTNGYNRTIDTAYSSPIAGRQAWSGDSGGYLTSIVNLPLSAYSSTIQLRWRCATDMNVRQNGWWIDNIAITGNGCCANTPPTLASPANRTINELSQMVVTNAAVDPGQPAHPLLYQLIGAPAGASIDTNGVITWTPADAQGPGVYTITTAAINSGIPALGATNSFTVTVKGLLTVTAASTNRPYGGTNPPLSGTLTGVEAGDNITAVFTTAATANTPVGSYPIGISFLDPDGKLGNYIVTTNSGLLTITPVQLTGTPEPKSRLYGQSNPVFTVLYSGFVNGENAGIVTGTLLASSPAETNSPVGAYPITASGQSAPNYTINYVPGTLTVNPASLLVQAQDASRVYGQTNPVFNVAYTGFVNAESSAVLGGQLSISSPAETNSPAGSYPIIPSGLLTTNYSISYSNGTLTVTPYQLVVTVDNKSRAYGTTNPPLTGSITGVQAGDVIEASFVTAATVTNGVGAYPISATLSDPGSRLGNYTVVTNGGTLTITPASLTGSVDSKTRIYGETNPVFTVSYSGFVNGENAGIVTGTLLASSPAATNSPVGAYPITASGQSAPNYTINYVPGTLTVNPASLLVQAQDASRVYGQTNPVFNVAYTGFVNAESSAVLGGQLSTTSPAETNSPAGSYPIIPSGLLATNYSISYSNGTLTVTPYQLVVAVDNKSRAYGTTNPPLTGSITGLQAGDVIEASFVTAATVTNGVGAYPISASLSDPGSRLGNYTVVTNGGTLTITPASLTGNVDSKTRIYGETNPVFTVSYSGFVNGENAGIVTGTLLASSPAETNSPVGAYPITASGQSAPNYTINYVPGTLTVNPAGLSIRANDATRPFGEPNPTFTATFSGFVNGETQSVLSGTLFLTTTADTNSPAGAYPIVPSGLSSTNYSISYSNGSLTVTPSERVVPRPLITSIVHQPNGVVLIGSQGISNQAYALQASPDFTNWTSLQTNTSGNDGIVLFVEPGATNQILRFYRTVVP